MVSKDWVNGEKNDKEQKRERGPYVKWEREIRNIKCCRRKHPHIMSIEAVEVRAVVWEIPTRKLWVNTERLNIVRNRRMRKIQPVV